MTFFLKYNIEISIFFKILAELSESGSHMTGNENDYVWFIQMPQKKKKYIYLSPFGQSFWVVLPRNLYTH